MIEHEPQMTLVDCLSLAANTIALWFGFSLKSFLSFSLQAAHKLFTLISKRSSRVAPA